MLRSLRVREQCQLLFHTFRDAVVVLKCVGTEERLGRVRKELVEAEELLHSVRCALLRGELFACQTEGVPPRANVESKEVRGCLTRVGNVGA